MSIMENSSAAHATNADSEKQQQHGTVRSYWNRFVWHGGSTYDAWLNAASAQVGQVILSMPTSYAQMGFGLGVFFHLLYASAGVWTCYLLACLYMEYRSRKEKQGASFHKHVIQYHEVMGELVGPWLRNMSLVFNIATMGAIAVVQIIACASDAYYLNSGLEKRTWALVFGAVSMVMVTLPSFENFRIWSCIGILTTTYTAWFMFIASLLHGQGQGVKHSGPLQTDKFFTGTTNILFAFGGHAITVELMHAMWRPRAYKYVYILAVAYVITITLPHSFTTYWAFGDVLLTHSNAFSVFPKSVARDIGLVFMIVHQAIAFGLYVMPLNIMWEKLLGIHGGRYIVRIIARIPVACVLWLLALMFPFFGPLNSLIGALVMVFPVYVIPCIAYLYVFKDPKTREDAVEKPWKWIPYGRCLVPLNILVACTILVLGLGFGGWASIKTLLNQVSTFGLFEKCYQC